MCIKAETMKRLIIILLGMFLGTIAMAQADPGKRDERDKEKTMKNLREDGVRMRRRRVLWVMI